MLDTCRSRFGNTTSIFASWFDCTVTVNHGGFLFPRSASSTRCSRYFCVFSAIKEPSSTMASSADGVSAITVLSSPKSSAAVRCGAKGDTSLLTAPPASPLAISGLFTLILHTIFEPSSAVTFRVFFVSFAGSFVYSGGVTITSLPTSAGKSNTVSVCTWDF